MSTDVMEQRTQESHGHDSLEDLVRRRDELTPKINDARRLLEDLLAAKESLNATINTHPDNAASPPLPDEGISAAHASPEDALESLGMDGHAFEVFGRRGLGFRTIPQLLSYSEARILEGLKEYFKHIKDGDPAGSAQEAMEYLKHALDKKGFRLES